MKDIKNSGEGWIMAGRRNWGTLAIVAGLLISILVAVPVGRGASAQSVVCQVDVPDVDREPVSIEVEFLTEGLDGEELTIDYFH